MGLPQHFRVSHRTIGLMKTFNFTTPPMPLLFRMYGYPPVLLEQFANVIVLRNSRAALKSTIAHRQNVPREFLNGYELAMFFPCELGWCEAWSANTPDRTTISIHTLHVLAQSGGTLALIFHTSNGSSCRFNALIPGSLLVALQPACFHLLSSVPGSAGLLSTCYRLRINPPLCQHAVETQPCRSRNIQLREATRLTTGHRFSADHRSAQNCRQSAEDSPVQEVSPRPATTRAYLQQWY